MKNIVFATISVAVLALTACDSNESGGSTQLSGAGASFPAPLYQRWAVDYHKANPSVQVNYQSVGSGAGVKQFTEAVVDFGASDAAMTDEEIAKVAKGVVMIPATAGSIVVAYNLPGVAELKLSRETLVDIFLGKITRWNDPKIAADNEGATLPNLPVSVATRSDGSGTTFVFTGCLSAISPEFAEKVGHDKSVPWPVGVGGKGNEGVTALIKQTAGMIGYVEYGYAANNGLSMATVQNKSGAFVKPTNESAASTLANMEMPEDLRVWAWDPEGAGDYPFVTFTWILLNKEYADTARLDALKAFVLYGLGEGQKVAPELGYVALPEAVVAKCRAAIAEIK